eukprot:208831-Rhodomonas_salina.5
MLIAPVRSPSVLPGDLKRGRSCWLCGRANSEPPGSTTRFRQDRTQRSEFTVGYGGADLACTSDGPPLVPSYPM